MPGRGRSTHIAMQQTRTLKAQSSAAARPCCRCGQPIDYSLEFPHPDSFSKDHYPHPLSTHPHLAEEPTNLAPSHLRCNQSAGNRVPYPALGDTGQEW